jgi:glucans biosynthesis protein
MKRLFRLGALLSLLVPAVHGAEPFDFDVLRARARALAERPHAPPRGEVPAWLRQLSYDQLRQIQFDGRESLWRGEGRGFQIQFLHPGFLYDRTVHLAEVRAGAAAAIPFRRNFFNYHGLPAGEMPPTMGFAGFRVMYPFGGADQPPDEAGSFLGASYFRFLCARTAYGLSARGLALGTAEPEPEEFPVFTDFWLERPAAGARELRVFALLDSPGVAGAYRFAISPGEVTVMHVSAVLHFRQASRGPGFAPLTSMFWRGENSRVSADDYRPEVHDSDGLLMHNGAGEWIWRPLDNPRETRTASFSDDNPRGFGLLQRDRNFENYQDLEASYHARPGAWVEPVGRWGKGAVRLVEIPTRDEFNDNVVAFWMPEKRPQAGEAVELEYRLHWFRDQIGPPGGFVRATRHGKSAYYEPGLERFVVDFEGGELRELGADAKVEPEITVGEGARLHHATVQRNPINGTWRVAFTLRPDTPARPVELRCFLRRGAASLTETWSFLWQP